MESQPSFFKFEKAARELSCKAFAQLRDLVLNVPNNKELFSNSIHYERLDKLVLWNSEDKTMQVRLHIYADPLCNINNLANISEAHNHCWNFSTKILSGGYFHTIYRMDFLDKRKYVLNPIMVRYEGIGNYYALHHSQYHSIIEEPNTVSLIVRGPVEKDSFQVISECGGEFQAKDSLTLQTSEEKKKKAMTLTDYKNVLNHLKALKIL